MSIIVINTWYCKKMSVSEKILCFSAIIDVTDGDTVVNTQM